MLDQKKPRRILSPGGPTGVGGSNVIQKHFTFRVGTLGDNFINMSENKALDYRQEKRQGG